MRDEMVWQRKAVTQSYYEILVFIVLFPKISLVLSCTAYSHKFKEMVHVSLMNHYKFQ